MGFLEFSLEKEKPGGDEFFFFFKTHKNPTFTEWLLCGYCVVTVWLLCGYCVVTVDWLWGGNVFG